MTEAAAKHTVPNPAPTMLLPATATSAVRDRMREIIGDLSMISSVAAGLADILEKAADASDGISSRALVRLAQALQGDALQACVALDRLWLDTAPKRRAEAAA